ncbi:DNA sulfur modification protein DndD [Metabacillus fastidiosus]|uniref:DNA sulfur modification protein DndD n=1 Tax=Metabacillus fastidiosus TaxID=1458 RepID=UPI00082591A6|nr:DNA sulfur modification protein DndD [Metabacillus fastidiosus]MED4462722.1 DNA sulfur modification protein DndD [Metabacillus fastidiosus]
MLIEQIKLENIGSYRGDNIFDLSISSSKKNVILIGGENGAGKTTFLNSIRLGLFGCYGYGYKTENKDYYKRVYSYLNSNARKQINEPFSITISFSEVENYRRYSYTFKRSWLLKDEAIKEQFSITKDGSHLNEAEADIYQSKLKDFFPPKLFDLCLFDGEEISRIISENKLSSYLQELSTVVFNLDLFNSLENDLTSYLQQAVSENQLSVLEKEVVELQGKEEEKFNYVKSLKNQINNDSEMIQKLKETSSSIKKDFETHGGLVKEERDTLNQQMLEIESKRRRNTDHVRDFIQNLLPFYLNKNLLCAASKQIQAEEKLSLFTQLEKELTIEKLAGFSDKLPSVSSGEQFAPALKNHILSIFEPEQNGVNYIHNLSPSQRTEIAVVSQTLEKERHETYVSLLKENRQMLAQAQELRQKINENDSASEFSQMLQQMEQIQEDIYKLEKRMEQNKISVYEEEQLLSTLQSTIEVKQNTINQGNKKKSSFAIAQNIKKLSTEFQKLQHQKKLQQVQIEATRMLNQLMRKHQYISSIRINPESFEVFLYGQDRDIIAKETLSAGEKEILLLSLIWAMFKCSGRRVPFIFDTLLGRLDKTHKRNILIDFIPSCGEQVLILSTNSEIDENHYELLKGHISHRYLLEFDMEKRQTSISHQYFNFQEKELTP